MPTKGGSELLHRLEPEKMMSVAEAVWGSGPTRVARFRWRHSVTDGTGKGVEQEDEEMFASHAS